VQSCRSRRSGHYAYYGITGNSKALSWFRYGVVRCWRKWLKRRNRERSLDWGLFNRLLARYPLPLARVVHSVYAHAASP
jgi:RNA-directed DNA polymerase